MGNPNLIALGPGILRVSAVGLTEPTDLTSPWPPNFVEMGYTFSGSVETYTMSTEDVEVAEELLPVGIAPTGETTLLKFVAAELTASNLLRARNGGTIITESGFVRFIPLNLATGVPVYHMYGWESNDGTERRLYRKGLNTGSSDTERAKGAAKAGIGFEVRCVKPSPGVEAVEYFLHSSRA